MAEGCQGALSVLIDVVLLFLKTFYYICEAFYRLIFPVSEKSVAGEIVLITGAGHGIGKELAMKYASLGATVVCWDVDEANNQKTVKHINSAGVSAAYAYKCDVSDREDVMRVANLVKKEVGSVTILVNNAGIFSSKAFLDHRAEEINRMLDVNLKSQFWTVQAFLPDMLARNHGHCVAISSLCGILGTTNLSAYSATKFAVRGLMECLKEEFRTTSALGGVKSKINFTTVFPFMVNTGLVKNPVTTFPSLTPLLTAQEVAAQTVRAQRTNVTEISIPGRWLIINNLLRIFPVRVTESMLDCCVTGSAVQD